MDVGFSCRKSAFFPGAHKNWCSHFRPQNCGQEFYGHEDFSDFFLMFGKEISWEIWREFCGIFSDPPNKGSKVSGKSFSGENFNPEVMQSGFGVNFYFGPANFGKIDREFLSEF